MKKLYTTALAALLSLGAFAQITCPSATVPQYMQGGSSSTNRTPFWFWADLTGLTPNATYRYYTAMDSLNASPGSNGAGNSYFINMVSNTFRRTTNVTLSNTAGYDSLVANSSGNYSGWFGVEPTANGRYTAGNTLYPKLMINNGNGGTSVVTRLLLSAYPVTIINYGTTSGNALQGSALYDSAVVSLVPPKSFAALYDNIGYTGRPISLAVVEMDSIDLKAVSSVAAFYRNLVDSFPQRWGTIIPNANTNGVRGLQYLDFVAAAPINLSQYNDNDGNWCSGAVTASPANGNTGLYLNSNFSLTGSMTTPGSLVTGFGGPFTVTTNGPGAQYGWDFGDGSPIDTTQNPVHTYTLPGTYTVTVTIQTPNCGLALTDSVVVVLFTGVNETNGAGSFSIAPNPGNGEFSITTTDADVKTISVLNLLGETIFETKTGGTNNTFDLTSQAKGVYLVRVLDTNGNTNTKKLVIR